MQKLALTLSFFLLVANFAFAMEEEVSEEEVVITPTIEEIVEDEILEEAEVMEAQIEEENAEEEFHASATFSKDAYLYQFPRKLKREFWEIPKHGVAPPETENLQANVLHAYERESTSSNLNLFSPRNLAFFGIFLALGVASFLAWFLRLEKQLGESEMEINRFEN